MSELMIDDLECSIAPAGVIEQTILPVAVWEALIFIGILLAVDGPI
jgi:hypothetical protein